MSAVCDFQPFAIGAGANVDSQATFLASSYLGGGFNSGIAASSQLNKVWRQASFVSASFAQFICNTLNASVLDNGSQGAFLAQIGSCIPTLPNANTWAALQTFNAGITVAGAKSTLAASTAGYASLNLPQGAAPSSPVNGDVWVTSSGVFARVNGSTVTLGSVGGANLLASNNLSDVANVATARSNLGVTATGGDTTYAYRGNNLSDLTNAGTARNNLGLGALATLSSIGSGQMSAGAAAGNLGFTPLNPGNNLSDLQSITTALGNLGIVKAAQGGSGDWSITLPGGLILKFGQAGAWGPNSAQSITFSTAFPNALIAMGSTLYDTGYSGSHPYSSIVTAVSASGFTIMSEGYQSGGTSGVPTGTFWWAVGR